MGKNNVSMQILDNYRITWDELNVVLETKRTHKITKKGERKEYERWHKRYYPSIKNALCKIIDEEATNSPDVSTLLERWDKLEEAIKSLKI